MVNKLPISHLIKIIHKNLKDKILHVVAALTALLIQEKNWVLYGRSYNESLIKKTKIMKNNRQNIYLFNLLLKSHYYTPY